MSTLVKNKFKTKLLGSNKLLVVQFRAEWSGGCQLMEPVYEELAHSYKGVADFFSVEADHHKDLFTQFAIRELPTIIFFRNYRVVGYCIGLTSRSRLITKIENALHT